MHLFYLDFVNQKRIFRVNAFLFEKIRIDKNTHLFDKRIKKIYQ
jgi:hypothetical protein